MGNVVTVKPDPFRGTEKFLSMFVLGMCVCDSSNRVYFPPPCGFVLLPNLIS